ncbi:MAG: hypothetical protein AMXMBFR8_15740 [Nevskiales bacterium]
MFDACIDVPEVVSRAAHADQLIETIEGQQGPESGAPGSEAVTPRESAKNLSFVRLNRLVFDATAPAQPWRWGSIREIPICRRRGGTEKFTPVKDALHATPSAQSRTAA